MYSGGSCWGVFRRHNKGGLLRDIKRGEGGETQTQN